MNDDLLFIVKLLIVLVLLGILWRNNRREMKELRQLDFSKCYHNQIHSFAASDVDGSRCDYCGRPFDDSIHKVR